MNLWDAPRPIIKFFTDEQLRHWWALALERSRPKEKRVGRTAFDQSQAPEWLNFHHLRVQGAAATEIPGAVVDERVFPYGHKGPTLTDHHGRTYYTKWNNRVTGDLYFAALEEFDGDRAILGVPGGMGTGTGISPLNSLLLIGWIPRHVFAQRCKRPEWNPTLWAVRQRDLRDFQDPEFLAPPDRPAPATPPLRPPEQLNLLPPR